MSRVKNRKKYTYELDDVTAYKLNSIVSLMKERKETNYNGKQYSKNIAVAEAIDYYYNSVINDEPSFFIRICNSITTTITNRYFKHLADSVNQILFNQVRQNVYNEKIAEKLNININEVERQVEQIIYDSFEGDY